jgi:peptidoglycan/LPS O-acetylase OafA/YrhL
MDYRKDINALRAIAVMAIMIFHFYPSSMPGAFAGVDVFFVISGFLMTGIIVTASRKNDFSLAGFYLSRIKRITPALSFLCLCLLIFGWNQLDPVKLAELAKHVVGALTFVSNFMFWHESGYFDQASSDKWLLHTWSLSVEWQFYLLFPLLLLFLGKFVSLNGIKYALVVITITSLLLSATFGYRYPDANFYLLPSRLWEFSLGGCAWLFAQNYKPTKAKWLQLVGLLLMFGSFFVSGTNAEWPGFYTLIPVGGALLVILANHPEQRFLCNAKLQRIGLWSYSIYLWHWPIAIWINSSSTGSYSGLLGIVLSIFVGFVSYELIEKRRRRSRHVKIKDWVTSKSVYTVIVISLIGTVIYNNQGVPSRFKFAEDLEELVKNRTEAEQLYRLSWREMESNDSISLCVLDNKSKTLEDILDCLEEGFDSKSYLVIGDSHGRDFLSALNIAYPEAKFNMLYQSSCAPTTYSLGESSKHDCFRFLDDINHLFIQKNQNVQGIIFASAFLDDIGIHSFLRDIEEVKYGDIPIYVSTISPMLNIPVVKHVSRAGKLKETYHLGSSNDVVISKNEKIRQLESKVTLFDKYAVFCEEEECKLIDKKYPYFWDTSHLSQPGLKRLAESIKAQRLLTE